MLGLQTTLRNHSFKKNPKSSKIFIFEKVAKGNVTLANKENPKYPRIWSSFYTSLHRDCFIFCSYPKKSSYTNCVSSLYYHIWPGNHNIWFPSGLVTFLSSKIRILEKNHFSAKKSTFQIWSHLKNRKFSINFMKLIEDFRFL